MNATIFIIDPFSFFFNWISSGFKWWSFWWWDKTSSLIVTPPWIMGLFLYQTDHEVLESICVVVLSSGLCRSHTYQRKSRRRRPESGSQSFLWLLLAACKVLQGMRHERHSVKQKGKRCCPAFLHQLYVINASGTIKTKDFELWNGYFTNACQYVVVINQGNSNTRKKMLWLWIESWI